MRRCNVSLLRLLTLLKDSNVAVYNSRITAPAHSCSTALLAVTESRTLRAQC
jgi:hypothetical protein